jgi:hypothetical protein
VVIHGFQGRDSKTRRVASYLLRCVGRRSLQRPPGTRPQPFVNQRQFATLLVGNAERERTAECAHPFDFAEQVGQVIVQVVARF